MPHATNHSPPPHAAYCCVTRYPPSHHSGHADRLGLGDGGGGGGEPALIPLQGMLGASAASFHPRGLPRSGAMEIEADEGPQYTQLPSLVIDPIKDEPLIHTARGQVTPFRGNPEGMIGQSYAPSWQSGCGSSSGGGGDGGGGSDKHGGVGSAFQLPPTVGSPEAWTDPTLPHFPLGGHAEGPVPSVPQYHSTNGLLDRHSAEYRRTDAAMVAAGRYGAQPDVDEVDQLLLLYGGPPPSQPSMGAAEATLGDSGQEGGQVEGVRSAVANLWVPHGHGPPSGLGDPGPVMPAKPAMMPLGLAQEHAREKGTGNIMSAALLWGSTAVGPEAGPSSALMTGGKVASEGGGVSKLTSLRARTPL
jgi:hypothetical protein